MNKIPEPEHIPSDKVADIHRAFVKFGIEKAVVDFYAENQKFHYLRLSPVKFMFYVDMGIPLTYQLED